MRSKNFAVGDTVWALWPGSKLYYEATVLENRGGSVLVNFKDGYETEVSKQNTYVSIVSISFILGSC